MCSDENYDEVTSNTRAVEENTLNTMRYLGMHGRKFEKWDGELCWYEHSSDNLVQDQENLLEH